MNHAISTVALPEKLFNDIARHASHEGMETDEWVLKALEERIRAERMTAEFFRRRAAGAGVLSLGEILDQGGDPHREPDPGDEL